MQNHEEIRVQIGQSRRNKARTLSFFAKAAAPCFPTFISTSFLFFILELLGLKINGANAVPDPVLSLLDSNVVELSKLQLLFHPSGKYGASTHFHSHQGAVQLFSTTGHSNENLQPIPQLHRTVALTFSNTSQRGH